MRFMRTHELIKTDWGYTFDGATAWAGGNNYMGTSTRQSTFYTLLEAMRDAGNISPWLQVEMCLSEEEWLGFVEWLAAPYDPATGDTPAKKPWASKRWSMGQKRPWLDEFPEFAFELANETWNQTFAPYDFDWGTPIRDGVTGQEYSYGAAYGFLNEYIINLMRSSPYWTKEVEAKTKVMLCGWQAAMHFGAEAARRSPRANLVSYAAYASNSGLGDPRVLNDFKRFYLLQWGQSAVAPQTARGVETERLLAGEGREIESGIYEYGPGYHVMPGDPQEAKEVDQYLARSMIAAVYCLDATLTRCQAGYTDQAFFTFGHRISSWGSHSLPDFGAHPYPFWKAFQLYNHYGVGRFLKWETLSTPTWDFPAYEAEDNMHKVKRSALPKAPMISVAASTRGDRVTLFLISRKLDHFPITGDDGFTPARVQLPFSKAKKITLHKLAGDPRVEDRLKENTKLETLEIPAGRFAGTLVVNETTGADKRGLPPASIFCYVFEGTDIGRVPLPPVTRFDLPHDLLAGQPVTARNLSRVPDGVSAKYDWDFGAAGRSTEPNPHVIFPHAGAFPVSLTVTTSGGLTDTLAGERAVGIRHHDKTWRPWLLPAGNGGVVAAKVANGPFVIEATGSVRKGSTPALATESYYRRDVAIEVSMEKIETAANAKQKLAGIALLGTLADGLGFGLQDGRRNQVHAGIVFDPDGAVAIIQEDSLTEVLPAGTVKFPVTARLQVKDGTGAAMFLTPSGWREIARFENLGNRGLMPGVIMGSGHPKTPIKAELSKLLVNP